MKQIFVLAIGLLTLVNQGSAQNIRFTEYDLKNGLHVILHEDHTTPIVAVTVLYHVGSKNEQVGRTGMAHFFEHLLFEGTENIGRGEYSKYVENAGGGLNANTSQDRTFYYDLLPSNQLELGLWLESERMMHAKVEKEGIETQREVVKEEKRQRYDNQPYGNLFPETLKRAYKNNSYAWAPIGSLDDLNAAKDQDFVDFYHMYYVPNNATLSIAGDFTPEQAKRWIEAYFGPIAKGKDIVRPTFQPEPKGEVRDVIKVKDQLPLMVQAYRIPAQGTPEFYAVDMLNTLLSNGTSSRLNKSIVEEKELAIFSGAFTFNLEDPGLTLSYTVANMGVDTQELEKAVNDEFVRLQNEPITDAEFQKLRNQIESNFISSNSSMAGIAESLANYHTYYGETNLINTEIERYMKVTKEDLMAAAKKYYTPDNRVTLFFEHDPSLLEK